jgi:hypothetical protein
MKPRVAEIVKEMVQYRHDRYISVQLGLLAELQSLLADEQAETAARMEQYTDRLVQQTDWLLSPRGFTGSRLFFWALVWFSLLSRSCHAHSLRQCHHISGLPIPLRSIASRLCGAVRPPQESR